MRTGAPADHHGFFHAALVYSSDDELVDVAAPFLTDGLDGGEPVIVCLPEPESELLRGHVGDAPGIDYVRSDRSFYAEPASALKRYQEVFDEHLAGGAAQIRVLGAAPHPGTGRPWDSWARYEAAANHAYADLPVWGLCAYDRRIAPPAVLADVERTHPFLATSDGAHRPNPGFESPHDFLRSCCDPPVDPIEWSPPVTELLDPAASEARRAVARACARGPIPQSDADDLVIAVSEIATNAELHGKAPVRLRVWTTADRVVVTVSDNGPGTTDPFAGLLPAERAQGGLGLWIAHQLCSHVSFRRDDDGFTVRLVAGTPYVSPV